MTRLVNRVRRQVSLAAFTILCLFGPAAIADNSFKPMELRLGSGEKSVENYVKYGYNAAIFGDVTQLADYDTAYPGVIAAGSDLRERIDRQRKKFEKDYDQANKLGLAVCVMTDEVSLPIPVWERLKASGVTNGIDFDDEKFWAVYREKYREVLKAYPRVAYVLVRTGENYSHPEEGFFGRTVLERSYDDAYFRHMQRLIEETRKVVVDEFGRTLIWRTWDLSNEGFHANPKVYDRVLAGLPDRRGLILAIKHTQTDFWRYNDFNPMIGRGHIGQIVEFQCAREYEGKGAFPNYIGPIFAEDMRRASALGAQGAWIWDFGGGWGGPFLKSDRWVRANTDAASRLAQNPGLSPQALARDWAAKEFGERASTNMAEMLMLSGDCVSKFMYIALYAREHRGWKPSQNLMRDDIIRGEVLPQLYEGSKMSLPEVFAEKQQAVALAAKMRELMESSRSDIIADRGNQVYTESLDSLIYMESLAKVMCHYVTGMFLFYQWQETHDPAVAVRARQELLAWKDAWQHYRTDVPQLPGVASLYRSQNSQSPDSSEGAMADLCEAAMQSLKITAARPDSVRTANGGNPVSF